MPNLTSCYPLLYQSGKVFQRILNALEFLLDTSYQLWPYFGLQQSQLQDRMKIRIFLGIA